MKLLDFTLTLTKAWVEIDNNDEIKVVASFPLLFFALVLLLAFSSVLYGYVGVFGDRRGAIRKVRLALNFSSFIATVYLFSCISFASTQNCCSFYWRYASWVAYLHCLICHHYENSWMCCCANCGRNEKSTHTCGTFFRQM